MEVLPLDLETITRIRSMPKNSTLTETVYEAILASVEDGGFPVGARLPSEWALCESYGASRPIIREVLARLRAQGIIESRKGSGSYVMRRTFATTQMTEDVASMAEIEACYDFRVSLEGECAYFAALNRNDDDVLAMRSAFEAFCSALSDNKRAGISDDFQFHLAIAEATHNAFFVNAFQSIKSRVYMAIEISRQLTATPLDQRRKALINEHRSVLNAIIEGNPTKARREMRRHVSNSKNRVFKGESH
ncbi:MAG TPA: FadR family transcriptional regulator [Kiloniellaceae bacterium]|nr:FadR family transcriptional regulator [Kiloniellaceae bacterium]